MDWLLAFLLAALSFSQINAQIQWKTTPKVVASSGIDHCPLQEESKAALEEIANYVFRSFAVVSQCATSVWRWIVVSCGPSQHG